MTTYVPKQAELTTEELQTFKKIVNSEAYTDFMNQEAFTKKEDLRTDVERTLKVKPYYKQTSKSLELALNYKQELGDFITKTVNSELYDKRQQAVLIEQKAEELKNDRLKQVGDIVESHNESNKEIMEYLEAEINAHERITPIEQKEIEFTNQELTGQSRTALVMATEPQKAVEVFNDLLRKAEHNPYVARFLVNNGYLFLERVEQLDPGNTTNKGQVMGGINKAKTLMYSEKQMVLNKVLEKAKKMKRSGSDGTRTINGSYENAKTLSKQLKQQYESELRKKYNPSLSDQRI